MWYIRTMRILVLMMILFSAGCATVDVDEDNPESVYKAAETDIGNDRYQLAIDKLQMLKNKHPYSSYSVLAKLKLADVFYLMEDYQEAAASYETFAELHPKHEKVPYARFRVGESFFHSMPSNTARDLSAGYKALDAYEDFLKKHSTDAKAPEARQRIKETRERLAVKQAYIGDFYVREDKEESAEGRYEKIIEMYPEAKITKEAKKKLANVEETLKNKTPEKHEYTGELLYQRYKEEE